MERCKSCKHWDTSDQQYRLGLGKCAQIPMLWDSTQWNKEADGRTFTEEHQHKKAFVQDGSDYFAIVLTKEDFGCVQHEPSA